MAITVDWGTKIIHVPQSYLTHISGTLYELDTDQFRLDLKSLEDDEEGMPFPKTHIHNTTYTIAGVTYARAIQITNGYQVKFEDGQYTVKLVGSNNNIFDDGVLVRNQVGVIATNSAGLIVVIQGSGITDQDKLDIADAVWDEQTSDHVDSGSFGAWVTQKLLTISKFIGLK